jgi:hypothetical protein
MDLLPGLNFRSVPLSNL